MDYNQIALQIKSEIEFYFELLKKQNLLEKFKQAVEKDFHEHIQIIDGRVVISGYREYFRDFQNIQAIYKRMVVLENDKYPIWECLNELYGLDKSSSIGDLHKKMIELYCN